MPGGDGTGPLGLGPMTGRAAGYCTGYNVPGYMNSVPGYGRGFGRGFGWGCGWGWRGYYYPPNYSQAGTDEEKRYLENAIKALEEDLRSLRRRLEELSKKENP